MDPAAIRDAFERFVAVDDAKPTMECWRMLGSLLGHPRGYQEFKSAILPHLPHKFKSLFAALDTKWTSHAPLRAQLKQPSQIVISGAGPCGLRAAIDGALCGHLVQVVELREQCSRHNILKTWQNTIDDMMNLGIASFVTGFKPHGHLHLGTRELQLCLLKDALMFGAEFVFGLGTCGLLSPKVTGTGKWAIWTLPQAEARAFLRPNTSATESSEPQELALRPGEQDVSRLQQTSKVDFFEYAESKNGAIAEDLNMLPDDQKSLVIKATHFAFDTLIIAEGESSRLIRRLGFDRKIAKYNEAIGIVANLDFSPKAQTREGLRERQLPEFVAWRSSATWKEGPLGKLYSSGIDVENMEYMRGTSTHFIAVTTKQKVLQEYGIVKEIRPKVRETLTADNMDFECLRKLARVCAQASGIPDDAPLCAKHGVQVFDFSCKGLCVDSFRKLDDTTFVFPIGDSLQNPFWPQGFGINRGFHNSCDAVWAAHVHAAGGNAEEERHFAFRLMDWRLFSAGVLQPGKGWTTDPLTRYSPDLIKSIHLRDIESKATESSIPKRYRDALGIKLSTK